MDKFASQLKKYRVLKHFTQAELASKVTRYLNKHIDQNNIKSYEGGTNPKIEVIYALAVVLDIPHQYLFDDSEKALNLIARKEVIANPDRYKVYLNNHKDIKELKKLL